ncbi:unnamed protein product [Prunus armeniaca]
MSILINLLVFCILCATLFFASTNAAHFDIQNNCPFTVWAAAMPGSGHQLNRGESWGLDMAVGAKGARIWALTGCSFDGAGRGRFQTGDCGGVLQCQAFVQPPNTLAEYALNQFNNLDFIDISLVDGFNVPMEFGSMSNGCTRDMKCMVDINGQCPGQLRAPHTSKKKTVARPSFAR